MKVLVYSVPFQFTLPAHAEKVLVDETRGWPGELREFAVLCVATTDQWNISLDDELIRIPRDISLFPEPVSISALNAIGGWSALFENRRYDPSSNRYSMILRKGLRFNERLRISVYNSGTSAHQMSGFILYELYPEGRR